MDTCLSLDNRFNKFKNRSRPLIACYLPVADPLLQDDIKDAYWEGGADILELGLPTKDPFLDGPDVAGTMERSFAGSIDPIARVLTISTWTRSHAERPASVCMAYPDLDFDTLQYRGGLQNLDGLLLLGIRSRPDRNQILEKLAFFGVRCIGFVPSVYSRADVDFARSCEGYVMLQAAPGATGPRKTIDKENRRKIAELKAEGVNCPILLGFGISTPDQAREACDLGADGVVIGSACVRLALQGPNALRDFVGSVRQVLGE